MVHKKHHWTQVVLSYPCEVCTAGPGDYCRSYTGTLKREPHASRALLAAEHDWRFPEDEEGQEHAGHHDPAG